MGKQVIVVGFDGSELSHKALTKAKAIAPCFDAGLHLVHVIDWSPFEFQSHEENESRDRDRRHELEHDRTELFPPILQGLEEAGIEASSAVLWGHPAETSAEEATARHAMMIIIGRTGRSSLQQMLLGSIASRTIRLAECPVLVVP